MLAPNIWNCGFGLDLCFAPQKLLGSTACITQARVPELLHSPVVIIVIRLRVRSLISTHPAAGQPGLKNVAPFEAYSDLPLVAALCHAIIAHLEVETRRVSFSLRFVVAVPSYIN